jgi:hypothetical protein
MRRHYGILAILALAYAAVGLTPATAQNQQPCCSFRVIHNFKLCLPSGCQQPQVTWNWNTQAAVWDLNNLPPTINTNSGSAELTACPAATASAPKRKSHRGVKTVRVAQCMCQLQCETGLQEPTAYRATHTAFGRACAICRMHGAHAGANSHIVISCPNITQGTVVWTPQFQDFIRRGMRRADARPCDYPLSEPAHGRYARRGAVRTQRVELPVGTQRRRRDRTRRTKIHPEDRAYHPDEGSNGRWEWARVTHPHPLG